MTYNQRAANCNRQLSMETSVKWRIYAQATLSGRNERLAAADE